MPGVRVTQAQGVPVIWAECLKNLLDVRGVSYTRVAHPLMGKGDNQALLYKLTAQKSLPVLFYNKERPRNSWVEQIVLADQLGQGPSLIPTDPAERVVMFGLMNELMGEEGIVWNKRLLFGENALTKKYGYSPEKEALAATQLLASLKYFFDLLTKQKAAGSKYMLGNSLTVLDVYFATVSIMFCPPGPEVMPRTKQNSGLLMAFAGNPSEIQDLIDASPWIEYRDYIYNTHLVVPAVLGGTPI